MEASKKFKIKEEDALYNDWLYDKAVSLFKVKDRYFYLKNESLDIEASDYNSLDEFLDEYELNHLSDSDKELFDPSSEIDLQEIKKGFFVKTDFVQEAKEEAEEAEEKRLQQLSSIQEDLEFLEQDLKELIEKYNVEEQTCLFFNKDRDSLYLNILPDNEKTTKIRISTHQNTSGLFEEPDYNFYPEKDEDFCFEAKNFIECSVLMNMQKD